MECGVNKVAISGDLPGPAPVNLDEVISCYLFDFTLTFTARRFNLREHFIAGFFAIDVQFTLVRRTFRQAVLVRVSVLNRQSRIAL